MSLRVGVTVFPGSCDDRDAARALELVGAQPVTLWHADADLSGVDAVLVPGGFSYGDYLRPGALAARSPVMTAVAAHAAAGGPVLGVCNGFQVLTEAGLLPGALRTNRSLRFRFHDVELRVERETPWLPGAAPGDTLTIPIKHHDGCFHIDPATLERLERRGQVLLRYEPNPNGSVGSVAGVTNEAGNVAGLMPHPEHAVDPLLGSSDGRVLLAGLLELASAAVA
ncbi:MAG TPA: phosphoribosylformylglycinamidine synthase subunit PurQ [Gaiellales bacterium]|nr:phosphoribosylformylglycinamidine synthase subunit PurQ [Gaiellales bacterium]